MSEILEIDSVYFERGETVLLSNIYMLISKGEIVCLLGRNGSGKSTLFNIVYGTLNSRDKSIRFDKKKVEYPFLNCSLIRFLPQFSILPKNLSVKQIFYDFNANISDFIKEFPLENIDFKSKVSSLSGGQKRLLEVYLFVKATCEYLILDEPFSYLMPLHIEKICEIIKREKANKGIILTDHLYTQSILVSDRIYILDKGSTFLVKNSDDLFQRGYLSEASVGLL